MPLQSENSLVWPRLYVKPSATVNSVKIQGNDLRWSHFGVGYVWVCTMSGPRRWAGILCCFIPSLTLWMRIAVIKVTDCTNGTRFPAGTGFFPSLCTDSCGTRPPSSQWVPEIFRTSWANTETTFSGHFVTRFYPSWYFPLGLFDVYYVCYLWEM